MAAFTSYVCQKRICVFMLKEQKISFKYDGKSESIKNNQIDARLLAASLDSFAELITAADLAVNEHETGVQVRAQAGFVPGSFGIELVVLADPSILKALGIVAAAGAGTALSLLQDLRGSKIDTIEIDEGSELATILSTDGRSFEVSSDVADLIKDKEVRAKIDKLIHQPLVNEGIDTFAFFPNGDFQAEPLIEINEESREYFKRPHTIQTSEREILETKAVVEFITANRESGKSGWKMNYLNHEDVSVKIQDEIFLQRIRLSNAPRIFAGKFIVNMKTVITRQDGVETKRSYHITRVIGPKKN